MKVDNLEQGFFGIGIQNGKTPENLGVLWRSAQNLGASFIFTTFEDFYAHLPKGAMLVGVELDEKAQDLETFKHPRRCVYLLGAEDHGLSKQAIEKSHFLVKFKSTLSLNVSIAGSIIMYDRSTKM